MDLISPQFANSNVDLPALPAEAYRLVEDRSLYAVMDIGGDDRVPTPWAATPPSSGRRTTSRWPSWPIPTGLSPGRRRRRWRSCGRSRRREAFLSPPSSTTPIWPTRPRSAPCWRPLPYMEELSRLSGLPIWMTTAEEAVAAQLAGKLPDVLPMRLQAKYFDLPEQRRAPPPKPLFG